MTLCFHVFNTLERCCVALFCNVVLHVALIFDMDCICTVFHKFPDFLLDFTTCRTYPRNHVLVLEDSPRSMKDKELSCILVNFELKITVGHAKGGKSVTSFELVLEHLCCGNRFKNCIYFSVNHLTIQSDSNPISVFLVHDDQGTYEGPW